MPTPFNFATDANLPQHIAGGMQAVADRRAACGLISIDGQTHRTAKAMALYDTGYSLLSKEYIDASFPKA